MTTFAEGRERNLALGIYGAASGSGAAAGVLLGGLLTSLPELVVDLLHQRPGRHRRDRAHSACCSARAAPTSPHRHFDLAGAASDHRRADAARLRDDARDDRRLGLAARRSACSPPPPRSSLAFVAIELRSPCAAPAAADLPLADARPPRTRRWRSSARSTFSRVLPADAVPAGRPPLLARCRAASRSSASR